MRSALYRDVRFAARALIRRPAFTASIVITLGLGISIALTMLSAMDLLFFRPPLGVRNPNNVVRVYFTRVYPGFGTNTQQATSYPQFLAVQANARSLADAAALYPVDLSFGRSDKSRPIRIALVSQNFFRLVGVSPIIGRFFSNDEELSSSSADVVVLSYTLWEREFARDVSIVGRSIYISGRQYTVIGIAQKFDGIDPTPVRAWLPLPAARDVAVGPSWQDPTESWIQIVARLGATTKDARANAELTSLYRATIDRGEREESRARASVGPLLVAGGPQSPPESRLSLWISTMAVLVYLIACANVENLMLQRARQRQQEVAIRVALGATRARIAFEVLAEGILLSVASAIVALCITLSAGGLITRYLLPTDFSQPGFLNLRVLIVLVLLSLIGGFACSLLPLRNGYSRETQPALGSGKRASEQGGQKLRFAFVAGQVALSALLLISASLFLRSLWNGTRVDLGIRPEGVLEVSADLRGVALSGSASGDFYFSARDRLTTLPQVASVSLASVAPLSGIMIAPVIVPGRDSIPQAPGGGPYVNAVTFDYFRTLGIRVLRGRAFEANDRREGAGVVIVNETMAQALWPTGDALGKCLRLAYAPSECAEIVGIVSNTHNFSLREQPSMQYYVPMTRRDSSAQRTMLVRGRGSVSTVTSEVRRSLQELYPTLPFIEVRPLQMRVDEELRPFQVGAVLMSVFGFLALTLTSIGLFGVIAYSVSQQTREIGIRLALGATGAVIIRAIMQNGLRAAAIGTLTGFSAALALSRVYSALLYGVNGADPLTFLLVLLMIGLVSVAGCYIPARSASRIDPVQALKAD